MDTDTADAAGRGYVLGRPTASCPAGRSVDFSRSDDVIMHRRRSLPAHPNGMIFRAYDAGGAVLRESTYYSVGGGFVVDEHAVGVDRIVEDATPVALSVHHRCPAAGDLRPGRPAGQRRDAGQRAVLAHRGAGARPSCCTSGRSCRSASTTAAPAPRSCCPAGCGYRDAPPSCSPTSRPTHDDTDPIRAMDWVNLYALAVNEENASGGRIVTAPTNGAAGIVPAVLHYYDKFIPGADDDGVVRFLLTAAAIGILFKENASISGAEVGCQGEVGSACAMAAGGLCEVIGGTPAQVENAAEIGIEHNLGLTCDPVGGLVQIPCIERNAMASNKAINAARIAIRGDGSHKVSLDKAIKTMRETGADMKIKYKETSRGGLAVNVIEC